VSGFQPSRSINSTQRRVRLGHGLAHRLAGLRIEHLGPTLEVDGST
jgi:hypothetical protein